ncbi:hypothetical protein KZZ10_10150 [Alcaligenaceae bacterium LF4-65]|uniref:Uncharacterized protein n=1 Tax=Zwartia hollandica TaxID=324606 RepID=A0A953T4Y0_9BURK|nr:hypothetical protein [Zwartia hollandica]MBZ1351006.1 hypothetical protein [Zwartia hollandica]
MVKAVYLAGNSYPGDRALEERVTQFLSARLGISTYPQSCLIPPPEQLTVDPLIHYTLHGLQENRRYQIT